MPGARDVRAFWENLRGGVESIRPLTSQELRAAGVDPRLLADPRYVKAGAPLEDVDQFDAGFFGFSPRDASLMDPQHRHFLEVVWEALEDAAYVPERFDGRIGIFAGSGMNAYMPYHLFTNPRLMASVGLFLARHTGNDKDFLTTRASYLFDLRGPSVNVQTACSTSLVAIHAASQSLISRECDMALAGGVTIELPHGHGYLYEEGEILSDDGHCRSFDRASKGTVFGSGAGIVVLRRLEDALEDRDTVHAVLKSSAVNNDGGRKVGYLAPSVDGQAESVAEALNLAEVPPESVTYVECHGTGTPVGDPIEVTGLTQAFRSLTDQRGFCAIGSVKSNIGHLDTAAGVASFIKVVEMLRHRTLVPSLHFREPNPEVDWASTPFTVNAETRDWTGEGPLRAGVNSLGVGGTNAHVILEEASEREASPAGREGQPLVLSARSRPALDRATERLASLLESEPSVSLADVAYSLAAGRRRFAERRVVVARSAQDAIANLRSDEPRRRPTARDDRVGTPVAFLFPGGGAQYPGMAASLYDAEPAFRKRLNECLDIVRDQERLDLRPIMFPTPDAEAEAAREMLRPSVALPALLSVELALVELLRSWDVTPFAMIGHSLGEYAAACVAGVFSLPDALGVVTCRGRLFETLPEGAMLSVPLPESEVEPLLPPGLGFAAINGPDLCLVSGEAAAVESLENRLADRGVESQKLKIAVAAHSPMLGPILERFADYLRSIELGEPTLPFVSNVSGTWIRPEEARDPGYWVGHLRQPVRFADGLEAVLSRPDAALLELGPGHTLTSLARSHPALAPGHSVIPVLRHPRDPATDLDACMGAVGRAWMAGVDLDWEAVVPGAGRISLPTYSFDHKRHWIEPGDGFFMHRAPAAELKNPDRGEWAWRSAWSPAERPPEAPAPTRHVLVFADASGVGSELVRELRAAGHTVDVALPGSQFETVADGSFRLRPDSGEDHATLLRTLAADSRTPAQVVHLRGLDDDTADLDGAVQRLFHPLVALAQGAFEEEPVDGLELVIVTSGAEGLGDDAPRHPAKALVRGPALVLPMELPTVTCRLVDLPAEARDAAAAARQLAAELDVRDPEPRVALGAGRFSETLVPVSLAERSPAQSFREGGTVVVTGGLGALALDLVRRIAEAAGGRFALLGRTGLPDRSEWDDLLSHDDSDDVLAARIRGVRAIEEAGGEVLVLPVDVASPRRSAQPWPRSRAASAPFTP